MNRNKYINLQAHDKCLSFVHDLLSHAFPPNGCMQDMEVSSTAANVLK